MDIKVSESPSLYRKSSSYSSDIETLDSFSNSPDRSLLKDSMVFIPKYHTHLFNFPSDITIDEFSALSSKIEDIAVILESIIPIINVGDEISMQAKPITLSTIDRSSITRKRSTNQ